MSFLVCTSLGTHCLGTPAAPAGMALASPGSGIPVNASAEYRCARGMKFEADFWQAGVNVTCLVVDDWEQNVDYGNCVESKYICPPLTNYYIFALVLDLIMLLI